MFGPVVQRIEWRFPEPLIVVRFHSGLPLMPRGRQVPTTGSYYGKNCPSLLFRFI